MAERTLTEPQTSLIDLAPPETGSEVVGLLADTSRSLFLRDLREKVVAYESINSEPTGTTPTVNDAATVKLEIFNPEGELIGRPEGAGRMLYRNPADGHFVAYFGELITLDDGNVVRPAA